jgi:predicted amidophosphoribosyltransferase
MKNLIFYTVKNAECDFCGKKYVAVTQVNNTYICHKCACEINKHARRNYMCAKSEATNENNN